VEEKAEKTGEAFDPPYVREGSRIYNCGRAAPYLLSARKPPVRRFPEISTLKGAGKVKGVGKLPLKLSQGLTKSCVRATRVGLQASSYTSHFLDGVKQEVTDLIAQVSGLPPELLGVNRESMLRKCSRLDDFAKRAENTNLDSAGSLVAIDANLTMAQRDSYLANLVGFMGKHAPTLRTGSFTSGDLFPNVGEIADKAESEASLQVNLKVATSSLPRGGGGGRGRGRGGAQRGGYDHQPFQGGASGFGQGQGPKPKGKKKKYNKQWRGGKGQGRGGGGRGGGAAAASGNAK
jgi:hypothetical protein